MNEHDLERNKEFVRRHFEEFVNRKNSAVVYENFSADFLDHDEVGGAALGQEAAKAMMEATYLKFPDLHVSIEDILAENDKVMVRNVWRGTDAVTGKRMHFKGFVLWRFADAKIVERWATVTSPVSVEE